MPSSDRFRRRILSVDDDPANLALLEQVLRRAGFTEFHSTTDPTAVVTLYADLRPDILLLDWNMPARSGAEVLDDIRAAVPPEDYFPVLVLTGDASPKAKRQALAGGANDFLAKPFDPTEVLLRVDNLLATQALHHRIADQNRTLEERVRERTRELDEARREALELLARAAEYRDDDTGHHTRRVGRTAGLLAHALGYAADETELIRRAAPLHDVGKIGIPDTILLKPGKLTPAEFDVMKTHTTVGAGIISRSVAPVLRLAEEVARTHHENWDGTGYPAGLAGDAIPMSGRIVAVADVFDALTHDRPYKTAWPAERAAAEVERLNGQKFDPAVVAAFAGLFRAGQLDSPAE